MIREINYYSIIGWFFGVLFLITGVLNLILVHPVPGVFYLLFSAFYIPPIKHYLSLKTGLEIPNTLLIVVAIFVLWATLAVGDLAEILGL
jgi:hypothetical protein